MGFFKALTRLVQGKPVFDVADAPRQPLQQAQPQTPPAPPPTGPKRPPQVCVERVECRENGLNMEVDCIIQNYSQGAVTLDRIELLHKTVSLNNYLRAGEEREYRVYAGLRPHDTYADECRLYYRNESGDYFCSHHTVTFQQQPDKSYAIDYIRFVDVQDV